MANRTWTLSTNHVSEEDGVRVRGYCNLLARSFTDRWLLSDNEAQCDVSFVEHDYLLHNGGVINDSGSEPIKVVICTENDNSSAYNYTIKLPLTSKKIVTVLNAVSLDGDILEANANNRKRNIKLSVKLVFEKFSRANFFNKKKAEVKQISDAAQTRRSSFVSDLKQKLNADTTPSYKIVFLGHPGSGKTTAIETVCGEGTLKTEVTASDSVAMKKEQTTIGIDYGEYNLSNTKMKLFGNPGQMRFGFMWGITAKDANAFIVLLDMNTLDPMVDFDFFMKILEERMPPSVIVYCGLTHCDSTNHDINEVAKKIKQKAYASILKGRLKTFNFDPRIASQTSRLLELIAEQLDSVKAAKAS